MLKQIQNHNKKRKHQKHKQNKIKHHTKKKSNTSK